MFPFHEVSRSSRMESPDMPGVSDCAEATGGSRIPSPMFLPSASLNRVGPPDVIDFARAHRCAGIETRGRGQPDTLPIRLQFQGPRVYFILVITHFVTLG